MTAGPYRVGVAGATGAVGSTILEVLAERRFPVGELVPLASARSAGSKVKFAGADVEVRELTEDSFQGLDLILSSAGGKVSSEWAPKWIEAGAVVVDNTSYWRMHEDVPLVVAGVNDDAVGDHNGLVANPNCTTISQPVAYCREAGSTTKSGASSRAFALRAGTSVSRMAFHSAPSASSSFFSTA